jgi:hypothetical protein
MNAFDPRRGFLTPVLLAAALAAVTAHARATGTAIVVQRDGSAKTYSNVRIAIRYESMAITSADGQGTIVLGKAACTKIGELLRCLPYDATLLQYGESRHIPLRSGTVWLNPTKSYQALTHSSAQLPPRGVMAAFETKAGTEVSLTGVVDEVVK